MTEKIDSFTGDYAWLSNFWTGHVLLYRGLRWKSAEHAYQAMKTTDLKAQERIRLEAPTPGVAKRMGQRVELRPQWNSRRISYMGAIINHKFTVGSELARRLVSTGDAYLEEGNRWGDTFWGTVDGDGENNLGQILMARRTVLQKL